VSRAGKAGTWTQIVLQDRVVQHVDIHHTLAFNNITFFPPLLILFVAFFPVHHILPKSPHPVLALLTVPSLDIILRPSPTA